MNQNEAIGFTPLRTAKHELFAQLMATGRTYDDAHEQAGYKRNHGNAFRMSQRPEVIARVAHLQGRIENEVVAAEALVRTAFSYSKANALKELEDIRAKALKDGKLSAAVSAVMGKAKLAGLLIEKHQHAHRRIEDMSYDELVAFDPELAAEFGGAGDAGAFALEDARPAGRA